MDIITSIIAIYNEIDRVIEGFQSATGMRCLSGCASCCREQFVEATVLEVLPLAMEIYLRNEEERIMSTIEQKEDNGDLACVILKREPSESPKGSCSLYDVRPLLCRLFGFATRRNKYGELELSTCRIIKKSDPSGLRRAEIGLSEGLKLPVYQELFMRIATMKPGVGYRRLPINQALREAITYIYWMDPRGSGWKKAANF